MSSKMKQLIESFENETENRSKKVYIYTNNKIEAKAEAFRKYSSTFLESFTELILKQQLND